jgi:hypothetical protein
MMDTLVGCRVAECNIPSRRKDPDELVRGDNWWECYRHDLVTIRSRDDWLAFKKKWFIFLDEDTLRLDLTSPQITDLSWLLRAFYMEDTLPTERRWFRLMQPQMFQHINACWAASHQGQKEKWSDAFFGLGVTDLIRLDEDGRLALNPEHLQPREWEAIVDPSQHVGHHILHLQKTLSTAQEPLTYVPPDWAEVAETVRRDTHKRKRIYSH